MAEGIRVTVEDLAEPGHSESQLVDDYIITTRTPCYVASITAHPNGTHVITVKNGSRKPCTVTESYAAPSEAGDG